MTLFDWFTKKKPAAAPLPAPITATGTATVHRRERLERRERLYAVVRDGMVGAGVLSSSYKFKVLSLDAHGQQYLVMVDIAAQYGSDMARLAQIEDQIVHQAQARDGLQVSAVYWRLGQSISVSQAAPVAQPAGSVAKAPAPPAPRVPRAPEPLLPDEIAAFKEALAASAPAPAPAGTLVQSRRRNPAAVADFEETELEERPLPLSPSQYGDLP